MRLAGTSQIANSTLLGSTDCVVSLIDYDSQPRPIDWPFRLPSHRDIKPRLFAVYTSTTDVKDKTPTYKTHLEKKANNYSLLLIVFKVSV